MANAVEVSRFERRAQQRRQMVAVTERLIAEYAGVIPAGGVIRCVSRCWSQLRLDGDGPELVAATEAAARRRLAAAAPAHGAP